MATLKDLNAYLGLVGSLESADSSCYGREMIECRLKCLRCKVFRADGKKKNRSFLSIQTEASAVTTTGDSDVFDDEMKYS